METRTPTTISNFFVGSSASSREQIYRALALDARPGNRGERTARVVAFLLLPYCTKSLKQSLHRKQALCWLRSARETKCLDVWILLCSISRLRWLSLWSVDILGEGRHGQELYTGKRTDFPCSLTRADLSCSCILEMGPGIF